MQLETLLGHWQCQNFHSCYFCRLQGFFLKKETVKVLTHHLIIVVCVKETVKYKDQRLEREALPSNNRSVSSAGTTRFNQEL